MVASSSVASTIAADWLGASRRATEALREILHANPTTAERALETGETGAGGDRTLEIDQAAEDAVFAELDRLHAQGARFTAISEERGTVDYTQDPGAPPRTPGTGGDPGVIVIVDPIDGSLNAKRGLPHHSISIAVAEGNTMGDVVFGYVYDFGPEEEWTARRGEGARLDGVALDPLAGERRSADGKLEVLGIESADPVWIRDAADGLAEVAHRIRALGTIAVTLCQVAAARLDGMVTLRGCRAVDSAAGQLIVREAGGLVAFIHFDAPRPNDTVFDSAARSLASAPLDLSPHSPVVAARTERGLRDLARVPR